MTVTQTENGLQVAARSSSRSGEGGIRTRGEVAPTQHFQCCTIGHSVTSPTRCNRFILLALRQFLNGNFLAKTEFGKDIGKNWFGNSFFMLHAMRHSGNEPPMSIWFGKGLANPLG